MGKKIVFISLIFVLLYKWNPNIKYMMMIIILQCNGHEI